MASHMADHRMPILGFPLCSKQISLLNLQKYVFSIISVIDAASPIMAVPKHLRK